MIAFPNLDKFSRILCSGTMAVACFFMFALALIGTVDTLMSNLLNRSLPGAIEISAVFFAAAVYLGMPSAQRFSSHIVVDVITVRLPRGMQTACKLFGLVCSFVFLAYLSSRVWGYAITSAANFERDAGVLQFPSFPFKLLALLGLLAITLEAGRQLLELIYAKGANSTKRANTAEGPNAQEGGII
jgi:TRAP-type C4-dicarboxylate transport system permease small subunit